VEQTAYIGSNREGSKAKMQMTKVAETIEEEMNKKS
jgi:hypothetical protein